MRFSSDAAARRRGLAASGISKQMHAGSRIQMPLLPGREAYLERLCADASPGLVAHIGCTASPHTAERLAVGALLHQRFVKLARVTGFDIDADALQLVREALPGEAFVLADVSAEIPSTEHGRYQLVLAGEVLEHVPDADAFLRGCRRLLAPGGRLCVTVPNACAPKIGLRSLAGREVVHPDHRTYYSPRTLVRTLQGAGFEPEAAATCLTPVGGTAGLIYHLFVHGAHRIFRGPVGEGLIAVARAL